MLCIYSIMYNVKFGLLLWIVPLLG